MSEREEEQDREQSDEQVDERARSLKGDEERIVEELRERERERPRPVAVPTPTPAPPSDAGLEQLVDEDVKSEREEEESAEPLEQRVTRSARPEDLSRMRSLAEKMYYEGWGRLSVDEQLAFIYHSRFLEHLESEQESRPEIRDTIYRFAGAQRRSLGSQYTARQLSNLNDAFLKRVLTPVNAPELYRRIENTDYLFRGER